MKKNTFYERFIKRLIDFFIGIISFFCLLPLFFVISVLIRIKLGAPILFRQQRPGLNEKNFLLYKFRTMSDEKDKDGNLLPDNLRLKRFGEWLRSTSIDELPSLLNVIKGEMSLVGPRPQLIKDLIFMTDEQRKRQLVRPGLTGLAQINGRNKISWDDKLKFDLIYVSQISFFQDLSILFRTVFKVLKRENINQEGKATSEDFGDYLLRTKKINYDEYILKMDAVNGRCL